MRIVLIGNFAPDRQESMLRFARLLASSLSLDGHDVETWAPEPASVRLLPKYRYGGPAKYFGYFDKFSIFPRRVRAKLAAAAKAGRTPDVVHIVDHANAVYAPLFAEVPLVVTCHDVMQIQSALGEFPQHRVPALGRRYQQWILHHLSQLRRVICVSQQTRRDLMRLAGLPAENTSVIHNGLNYPYRPLSHERASPLIDALLRERNLPTDTLSPAHGGFLLNVGGGQWYKNRRGLLEIYAALRRQLAAPPRLVMVGKPLTPELKQHLHALELEPHVVHLSNLTEKQLQALYSRAEGLIFPSWHEGFGWPIAEAQACGCPVFTSNREPMTEVGGDAAIYLDPADAASAARTIAAAWPERTQLSARGLVRAAQWRTEVMTERYLEAYAESSRVHTSLAA